MFQSVFVAARRKQDVCVPNVKTVKSFALRQSFALGQSFALRQKVKSKAYAFGEIVRFSHGEMKSNHPAPSRISPAKRISHCKAIFHPPVRVDLVKKRLAEASLFSGTPLPEVTGSASVIKQNTPVRRQVCFLGGRYRT